MKKIRNVFKISVCSIFFFLAGKVNAQNDTAALNQAHVLKSGSPVTNNANPSPKTSRLQASNGKGGSVSPGNAIPDPIDTLNITPPVILMNKKQRPN